jgi:hypothetical protein
MFFHPDLARALAQARVDRMIAEAAAARRIAEARAGRQRTRPPWLSVWRLLPRWLRRLLSWRPLAQRSRRRNPVPRQRPEHDPH